MLIRVHTAQLRKLKSSLTAAEAHSKASATQEASLRDQLSHMQARIQELVSERRSSKVAAADTAAAVAAAASGCDNNTAEQAEAAVAAAVAEAEGRHSEVL
jgi:hypothetical protein